MNKTSHANARFDVMERELRRIVRMEQIEQGITKSGHVLEKLEQRLCGIENEMEKLASDLKKFSVDVTASMKSTGCCHDEDP